MATPNPPLPPTPPPRTNNSWVAVLLGVGIVVVCMIAFGIFVALRIAQNTRVVQNGDGSTKSVEIHSPFGDLKVNGEGKNAKVDIRSPFGSVHVTPTPDISRLDMDIYPGATLVPNREDSPFHDGYDFDGINVSDAGEGSGAQVRLSSGQSALNVDVAEFRTSATPEQVLQYYFDRLGRYGTVVRKQEHNGATSLRVVLDGDKNVRAAAIKPGSDGTHFVLVRVIGDSGAR
jgi:hypothetical protein